MAKVISQLPSGGSVPKHNNLLGLNEGDYLHLTQFEKAKLDGIQSGAEVNVNADWNAISGDAQILNKPTSFPPSTHTHVISDITGLQGELDNKLDENNPTATGTLTLQTDPSILIGTFDILVRNPSSGVVSKVPEATYRKSSVDVPWMEISGKPSTFPPSAHNHTILEVTGLQGELDVRIVDSQIEVSSNTNISNLWNGKTILFIANCTITVPATLLSQYGFVFRTLAGVTVTWAITAPFTWETTPTTTPEKTTGSFMRRGNTNTILLDF